jgi:cysteine desulfurase
LYVREDTVAAQGGLRKFMIGANHEQNRRAGTENVQLIAGLGAACQDITDHLPELMRSFAGMRDGLLASIRAHLATLIQAHKLSDRYTVETTAGAPAAAASSSASTPRPAFVVHCAGTNRLSNTLSIGFHGVSASEILHRLRGHVAASAGAACHADAVSLSYVLSSMRVDPAYGMGTLRLSVGRYNTARELEEQVGPWIAKVVVQLWLEQRAKSETDAVGNYARVSAH